jgi:hypothetical protein
MNQNILPISNAETIELKINSTSGKIKFPYSENLAGKKITGIEAFKVGDVAVNSVGDAVINNNAFADAFVTLQIKGREKIKTLPLASFYPGSTNKLIKSFNNIIIDIDKSYIEFGRATNVVAGEVILLAFYYED